MTGSAAGATAGDPFVRRDLRWGGEQVDEVAAPLGEQHEVAEALGLSRKVRLVCEGVLTVDAETSAAEAAGLLNNNKFGSLPVTKNEKLVGIVTAGDFMRVALRYLDRELREL